LGVTLYSLIIGNVPFHDDNILALYNKIRTQPFAFPEERDISPELKDLITKMLIKVPFQRISLKEIKVRVITCPTNSMNEATLASRFTIG